MVGYSRFSYELFLEIITIRDLSTWHVCRHHRPMINCLLMLVCKNTVKVKLAGGLYIQLANRDRKVKRCELEMTLF